MHWLCIGTTWCGLGMLARSRPYLVAHISKYIYIYMFEQKSPQNTRPFPYLTLNRPVPVPPSAAISWVASIIRIASHTALHLFMNIRHSTFSTYLGLHGGWCVLAKGFGDDAIAAGLIHNSIWTLNSLCSHIQMHLHITHGGVLTGASGGGLRLLPNQQNRNQFELSLT